MKKAKLAVNRETLRQLSVPRLDGVRGGTGTDGPATDASICTASFGFTFCAPTTDCGPDTKKSACADCEI